MQLAAQLLLAKTCKLKRRGKRGRDTEDLVLGREIEQALKVENISLMESALIMKIATMIESLISGVCLSKVLHIFHIVL